MAIERLSFPNYLNLPRGIPIAESETPEGLHRRLVNQWGRLIQVLQAGHYDLTPELLPPQAPRYTLDVLENGEGEYRFITSNIVPTNITFVASGIPTIPGEAIKEGYLIKIPQDTKIFLVAVNLGAELGLRVFELLYYSPGESPK